jgi:3-methyladenine DNA glycosylase AlkD
MSAQKILDELKSLGSESIKNVLVKHGAQEPFFGVKVEHLKKIQKRIKMDYKLALELYDTGISDAMYLAGLIADDARMTKKDLQRWVKGAYWYMLSEFTVPWVAAGSHVGHELALEWIDSKKENVAAAGWATLSNLVRTKDDAELDLAELKKLLERVGKTIHQQPNRVRHVMNAFVIAVGSFVKELTDAALDTASKVGAVSVDMGGTACKVPDAVDYINKVKAKGGPRQEAQVGEMLNGTCDQIQNPKSEARNPKQIRSTKTENPKRILDESRFRFFEFWILDLFRISYFVFRASSFL